MIRRRYCACVFCAVLASLAAALLLLTPHAARAEEKPVSFIDQVAPILKENCFACHDAKKRSGKYDMTTFTKLVEGGAIGDAVVEGKPEQSELYALMVTDDVDLRMPPEGKGVPVPEGQLELIRRWIAEGAKLDAGIDPGADLVRELAVRWSPPQPPAAYPYPAVVNSLTFTPDGTSLVVGGHHELTFWDVESAALTKRIHTRAERAYDMVFLADGTLIVAGGRPGQEGDLKAYSLDKAEGPELADGVNDPTVALAELVRTDDSVLCVALSKDGKKLAAGGCDRTVRVWDVSKGAASAKLEQEIENHADWVLGVSFSDDGKLLLTASRDKTAKVWDLQAKESMLTYPEHQEIVFAVGAQPDAKVGYSVGADRQVRWWNVVGKDAGKRVRNSGGHGDEIYKLARHPKEDWLITCSADKTVRIWNAGDGKNLKTLSGMTDYVYDVSVSPDGSMIAAGGYDGLVTVWKTDDGSVVKQFNASPGYSPPAGE